MRRVRFSCEGKFSCSKEEMSDALHSYIASLDAAPYVDAVFATHSSENILEVSMFFVQSPVRFHLGEGRLTMEVDSTTTGPGYHAAMLGTMELLEATTPVRWDKSTLHDDTGYCAHRDFKRLQAFMQDWLQEHILSLVDTPETGVPPHTGLTMPSTITPVGQGYFACYDMGYLRRDFFDVLRQVKEKELLCQAFFIWWDEGVTPELHLKTALNLIWCHINWLPPELDQEFVCIEQALTALELAWQEQKDLPFPVPEWIEMAILTRNNELAHELLRRFPIAASQPPSKGYLRQDIQHSLGENTWRITLPGKMHKAFDEASVFFWDNRQRSIRISTSRGMDDHAQPLPGMILAQNSVRGLEAERRRLPQAPRVPAYILHETPKETGLFRTTLFAAQDGQLIIVSIQYPQAEERPWAILVCDSLVAT